MATPKRLFIPGKTASDAHPMYKQDMRTLEIFNPINKLVAGSGVTLDPASGSGPQVKISAAGGSGIGGIFNWYSGPDESAIDASSIWLMPSRPFDLGVSTSLMFDYADRNNWDSISNIYTIGCSWMVFPSAGQSVCFLPLCTPPVFTGALNITVTLSAFAVDASNFVIYRANSLAPLMSQTQVQFSDTDFSVVQSFGADIVLTPGTGLSGNGLVSQGGVAIYLASAMAEVSVASGTTFP